MTKLTMCHTCQHQSALPLQALPASPWAQAPDQLLRAFLGRLPTILPAEQLPAVHALTLHLLTNPVITPRTGAQVPAGTYHLRLAHRCRATSCALATCKLCERDPLRPCDPNRPMADHFCVGDILTSHCEAEKRKLDGAAGKKGPRVSGLHVTVHRQSGAALTAEELMKELPDLSLQVCRSSQA